MVYTDGIHLIASSIDELHQFANMIGLHKCYFRNPRKKRHPHYDIMTVEVHEKVFEHGAQLATDKELVKLCRKFYGNRVVLHNNDQRLDSQTNQTVTLLLTKRSLRQSG